MRIAETFAGARADRPAVSVEPVEGPAAFAAFLRLPGQLYRGHPGFVPPLLFERGRSLDPKRSAFFRHAEGRYWLARREGRVVGRISAQIDRLHLERHRDGCGFFGLLDAIDDPAVFAVLLAAAEAWLAERGMKRVRGPFNLSINEECGLLVEGFETPPMLMMGYAPPYAAAHVEARGYAKAKDLLAFLWRPEEAPPVDASRLLARMDKAGRVRVRPAELRRYGAEIDTLIGLFNDAWADNWSFVPFTPLEMKQLADGLRPLIDPALIRIAEVDGEPACMVVAVPDLNAATTDLDGRLLPVGWAKLLWRLKVKGVGRARIPLMGLARRFHRTPLAGLLLTLTLGSLREELVARRYREVEMSWILEDNLSMRRLAEGANGRRYKTYRLYERTLP